LTVGHGGEDDNRQSVDDDVVEETGVEDLKCVVVSDVSAHEDQRPVCSTHHVFLTTSHPRDWLARASRSDLCTVDQSHHVIVQVARNVEDDAQSYDGDHL